MTTEDFFIYFTVACFLVVLIWGLRWIFQIFCSSNSILSPNHVTTDNPRRVRTHRIRRSELMPPPPPPYSWQPGQSGDQPGLPPRISVYTVTIGNRIDVPDEGKLPKYEEIFPTGPPSYDNVGFSEHFDSECSRPAQRASSQDSIVAIERY